MTRYNVLLFPVRLKTARKRKGLTQKALGAKVVDYYGRSLARQTIVNYEVGTSTPSLERLVQLAEILGVSVDWLAGADTGTER